MKWLAIVAGLLLALWLWTNYQRHSTEHRLGTIASQLAGRRVGVRCQGFWAAMLDINDRKGEVDFAQGRTPNHMFLTRDVCGRLRRFDAGRARSELDCLATIDWSRWSPEVGFDGACERRARGDVQAINTLTHEAMHLRGFVGEAQAQCYAIQEDAWTVMRFGGTAVEGAAAAAFTLALQPFAAFRVPVERLPSPRRARSPALHTGIPDGVAGGASTRDAQRAWRVARSTSSPTTARNSAMNLGSLTSPRASRSLGASGSA
jgi:hypothetical protein